MTVLLLGFDNGIARVSLNGRARAEWTLQGVHVSALAVDPLRPERAYAATMGEGLLLSDDGGLTFKPAGSLKGARVWSLEVSRSDRSDGLGAVYAGTEPSALHRSEDGGRTFHELESVRDIPGRAEWSFPPAPDTHHVHSIALSVADPQIVIFGVELGGVYRSDDRGATWAQVPADPDPHTLRTHPDAPERIYEGGGASYVQSDDSGLTWHRDLNGIPDSVRYFYSLAVDSHDPDNVLISAARDPFSGHGVLPGQTPWSTVYRRRGRRAWEEVTDGLPPREGTEMGALVADPRAHGSFFYITTRPRGLYRSLDGGESWSALGGCWPEHATRRGGPIATAAQER
ncbi:MAG TPA: hypothetical protein VKV27_15915 [Solirubrobacteraceae bacterium]|nr:hypothetical protein [Solirubrobacteraceae bacterium]